MTSSPQSDDYGRTDEFTTASTPATFIRYVSLPLAKQAEMNEILKDIEERGGIDE
jgi:hypothetical protein